MAAKTKSRVCLVDNDSAVRDSFSFAAKTAGFEAITFASAQEFLAGFNPVRVGCIVLDVRLPGMSGLELQEILKARKTPIPILILTGHANVAIAVQAIKNGAMDVLEKPFTLEVLVDRVRHAFDVYVRWQKVETERQEIAGRMEQLTRREREVMGLMADGVKNREIAERLGISKKTLDLYRANVVYKMKARTSADIARWRLLHESGPGGTVTIKPGGYLHALGRSVPKHGAGLNGENEG